MAKVVFDVVTENPQDPHIADQMKYGSMYEHCRHHGQQDMTDCDPVSSGKGQLEIVGMTA